MAPSRSDPLYSLSAIFRKSPAFLRRSCRVASSMIQNRNISNTAGNVNESGTGWEPTPGVGTELLAGNDGKQCLIGPEVVQVHIEQIRQAVARPDSLLERFE